MTHFLSQLQEFVERNHKLKLLAGMEIHVWRSEKDETKNMQNFDKTTKKMKNSYWLNYYYKISIHQNTIMKPTLDTCKCSDRRFSSISVSDFGDELPTDCRNPSNIPLMLNFFILLVIGLGLTVCLRTLIK